MAEIARGSPGGGPGRAFSQPPGARAAAANSALLADILGGYIDPQSPLGRAIRETERARPGDRPWPATGRRPLAPQGVPLATNPVALLGQMLLSAGREELMELLLRGWRDQAADEQLWPVLPFTGGPGWTDITGNCAVTYPQGLYQPGNGLWYKTAVCNPSLLGSLPAPIDPYSEAVLDNSFGMRTYSDVIAPGGANYISQVWTWNDALPGADPAGFPAPAIAVPGVQPGAAPSFRPGWRGAALKRTTTFRQGYEAGYAVPLEDQAEPIGASDPGAVVAVEIGADGAVYRVPRPVLEHTRPGEPATQPAPSPRPVPSTSTQPLPLRPGGKPVRVLTRREAKLRMPAYRRALVVQALENTLEGCDLVDALFKALPQVVQRAARQRWVEGEFARGVERPNRKMPCEAQAAAVFEHRRFLEGEAVLREVVWMNMEDWAYGVLGKPTAEAVSRVQARSGGTISPGYEHSLAPGLPLEEIEQAVTGRAARARRPPSAEVRAFAIDEQRRRSRNRRAELQRRVAYRRTFGR